MKYTQGFDRGRIDEINNILQPLITSKYEMSPDLSYRNAIHDCLDFDNPLLNKDNISILLKHLGELPVNSTVTKEILQGLLPRFLGEKSSFREYSNFFQDQDGRTMNSKFSNAVHYSGIPQSSKKSLHIEFSVDTDDLNPVNHMRRVVQNCNKSINKKKKKLTKNDLSKSLIEQ